MITKWIVNQDMSISDHNLITFSLINNKSEKSRKNVWKIEEIFFMDFRKDLKTLIEYFREIEINRHNIDDLLEQFDEGLRWICEKNKKPQNRNGNLMQYGGIQGWRSREVVYDRLGDAFKRKEIDSDDKLYSKKNKQNISL
ncbi:hypothetical protein AVEN_190249-1 [Araneus ventricosus]|uniref:Uncharacterized protein n=1 Tax=Araneus ventricosus TaxID=182803 RepID=A0A4Y2M3E5_ARAVE|nr:hypothetical protein AVEN_190249-1 [Araneus ventricosus]